MAIIALLLLIEHAVLDMNNKDHGPKWIPYVFAGLALLFHTLATALWFGTMDAKWEDDCDDFVSSDERPDVCVEQAPKVAVAAVICLLVTVVIFVVAYCCYGQNGVWKF